MTTNTDNPYKLTPTLQKRYQQFQKIDDSTKRFERIIALGKRLESFPEDLKSEDNKVHGCASLVYIYGNKNDEGLMQYQGWSNSHLVLGLISLLIEGVNNSSTETILNIDPVFIEGMGLSQTLTASRANGFINTFNKIKEIAYRNS
jgi:cysteine desulfuration protein SufE